MAVRNKNCNLSIFRHFRPRVSDFCIVRLIYQIVLNKIYNKWQYYQNVIALLIYPMAGFQNLLSIFNRFQTRHYENYLYKSGPPGQVKNVVDPLQPCVSKKDHRNHHLDHTTILFFLGSSQFFYLFFGYLCDAEWPIFLKLLPI